MKEGEMYLIKVENYEKVHPNTSIIIPIFLSSPMVTDMFRVLCDLSFITKDLLLD
jgi:hypothetical protein